MCIGSMAYAAAVSLILARSLPSFFSSAYTLRYLAWKVVLVACVRFTDAPGIAGCTALRLPGGTRTAAWAAEAVAARSMPRKRGRIRLMRRPVLVGRKLCRARSRVETCRAYRGESPAGASLAPQSAPSSHVEL